MGNFNALAETNSLSPHAQGFMNVHSKGQVCDAIFRTLAANGMRDDTWIKIILTPGEKDSISKHSNHSIGGTTLVITAEWEVVTVS